MAEQRIELNGELRFVREGETRRSLAKLIASRQSPDQVWSCVFVAVYGNQHYSAVFNLSEHETRPEILQEYILSSIMAWGDFWPQVREVEIKLGEGSAVTKWSGTLYFLNSWGAWRTASVGITAFPPHDPAAGVGCNCQIQVILDGKLYEANILLSVAIPGDTQLKAAVQLMLRLACPPLAYLNLDNPEEATLELALVG